MQQCGAGLADAGKRGREVGVVGDGHQPVQGRDGARGVAPGQFRGLGAGTPGGPQRVAHRRHAQRAGGELADLSGLDVARRPDPVAVHGMDVVCAGGQPLSVAGVAEGDGGGARVRGGGEEAALSGRQVGQAGHLGPLHAVDADHQGARGSCRGGRRQVGERGLLERELLQCRRRAAGAKDFPACFPVRGMCHVAQHGGGVPPVGIGHRLGKRQEGVAFLPGQDLAVGAPAGVDHCGEHEQFRTLHSAGPGAHIGAFAGDNHPPPGSEPVVQPVQFQFGPLHIVGDGFLCQCQRRLLDVGAGGPQVGHGVHAVGDFPLPRLPPFIGQHHGGGGSGESVGQPRPGADGLDCGQDGRGVPRSGGGTVLHDDVLAGLQAFHRRVQVGHRRILIPC